MRPKTLLTESTLLLLAGGLAAGLALPGCDLPPTDYTAPDAEVGDTGGDSDTLVGPEECPRNSGYPCTCDIVGDDCADESRCLYTTGDGELGFCSAKCFEPYSDCVKTGFAAESTCALDGGGASFRCALVCEEDEQCPPDQDCVDLGWETLCHP